MPYLRYPIVILREQFQHDLELHRALPLDQIARLIPVGDAAAASEFRQGLEEAIRGLPLADLHRQQLPPELSLGQIELTLEPPRTSLAWQSPVTLSIPYCSWNPSGGTISAYVPIIQTALHAKNLAELERVIGLEVRSHLSLANATQNLRELHGFTMLQQPSLEREETRISIQSPREKEEGVEADKKETPTLKKIGTRLLPRFLNPAWLLDDQVLSLAELLNGSQPQSVLLSGPAGVGKSAAFRELARRADSYAMAGTQFWETSGSRLIAGMSGFGEWQDRCNKLIEELQHETVVLHIGSLMELIEVGRGGGMKLGIADFLIPHIARRKILVVVECTPEQISIAEKESPRILDVLQRLNFVPPSPPECCEILEAVALHRSQSARVTLEPSAIAATELLHRRFALYSPAPGRAIQFLNSLIDSAAPESSITRTEVVENFAAQTGLPLFLLSESEALDLQAVEQHFSQRLIGQPEPVERIVDTIAAMKANLNRPGRPIGSYLFIGPTGVGKTELAKAMAEFMYGDAQRLIRIDMSEYSHAWAASRLIGGLGEGEGILTSKVREQPFTVVLLDEFEKAHPAVFDLLLQVLGEGRLTDGRGQPADFTTSIIIMTSNLGVESFREGGLGFSSQARSQSWREHFIAQLQKFVRPEFFNRIDQIVPFQPLDVSAMQQITRRELKVFRQRHGIAARRLQLQINPEAVDWLVAHGHEIRYGARPLKRLITKRLIQPLANQLNRYAPELPVDAQVDTGASSSLPALKASAEKTANSLQVAVRPSELVDRHKPLLRDQLLAPLQELARQRRRSQALNHSPIVERIRNQIFRLEQSLNELAVQKERDGDSAGIFDRVIQVQRLERDDLLNAEGRARQLQQQVCEFEDQSLRQLYSHQALDWSQVVEQTRAFERAISEQILNLFLTENPGSERVVLLLFSRNHQHLKFLYDVYVAMANKHGLAFQEDTLHRYTPQPEGIAFSLKSVAETAEAAQLAVDVRHRQARTPLFGGQDQIGIALTIKGRLAFHWFSMERGVHRFNGNDHEGVLVETTGQKLFDHQVPQDVQRLPLELFTAHPFRRHYNTKENSLHDVLLDRKLREIERWPTQLVQLLEDTFDHHLNQFVNTWI